LARKKIERAPPLSIRSPVLNTRQVLAIFIGVSLISEKTAIDILSRWLKDIYEFVGRNPILDKAIQNFCLITIIILEILQVSGHQECCFAEMDAFVNFVHAPVESRIEIGLFTPYNLSYSLELVLMAATQQRKGWFKKWLVSVSQCVVFRWPALVPSWTP
jgi:hypothetical protein